MQILASHPDLDRRAYGANRPARLSVYFNIYTQCIMNTTTSLSNSEIADLLSALRQDPDTLIRYNHDTGQVTLASTQVSYVDRIVNRLPRRDIDVCELMVNGRVVAAIVSAPDDYFSPPIGVCYRRNQATKVAEQRRASLSPRPPQPGSGPRRRSPTRLPDPS
jgi:hypothetical protein